MNTIPLYDFVCNECGAKFEDIIKSDDKDQVQVCRECHKMAAVRAAEPTPFTYSLKRSFSRMRAGV